MTPSYLYLREHRRTSWFNVYRHPTDGHIIYGRQHTTHRRAERAVAETERSMITAGQLFAPPVYRIKVTLKGKLR